VSTLLRRVQTDMAAVGACGRGMPAVYMYGFVAMYLYVSG